MRRHPRDGARVSVAERIAREELLVAGPLVRVPFLVRGELVAPPAIDRETALGRLGDEDYARAADLGVQLLRERLVDRRTMEPALAHRVLVMPDVDGSALLPADPGTTREALAAIPFASVADWLDAAGERLAPGSALGGRLADVVRATSDLPDAFLDVALGIVSAMFRRDAVRETVDRELALGAVPGATLLDAWIDPGAPAFSGATAMLPGADPSPPAPRVRAFPTLQLHVTAGNAPVVAPTSALRMLATKSAGVVKLPSGAVPAGAALAVALAAAAEGRPEIAPALRATSLVYFRGGDERVERPLFDPRAVNRVVVWGAPDAVERVGALAGARGIRTVVFEPRYGVSLVGQEALADESALATAAARAAADTLVWNQRACIASWVHYVEADAPDARRYALALRDALARADAVAPSAPSHDGLGAVRRLRRGALVGAEWLTVGDPRRPRAAVVLVPGAFDLAEHPLSRVAIVRPVAHLEDVVALAHRGVSTAGVFPEPRRLALRDALAARGVSNVVPLGSAERGFVGMPHDGMRVLCQLVDWVDG